MRLFGDTQSAARAVQGGGYDMAFVVNQMRLLAQSVGAKFSADTDNPEWEPNPDSLILKVFTQTYRETFGVDPKVEAVHAGLECGYFSRHYPDMDLISIGPTIHGAHSQDETLFLETTPKLVELLANVLEKLR